MQKTTTQLARSFLIQHPNIRECLLRGLVNYSALARLICKGEKAAKLQGAIVALRRYRSQHKQLIDSNKKILDLVVNTHISVVNRMAVAVVKKTEELEKLSRLKREIKEIRGEVNIIEGRDVMTIIHPMRASSIVRELLKGQLKRIEDGLAQINMVFDERLETTPGVVAYVYGLLAEEGINIREEMSCGTDLMIIIAEKDLAAALEVLSFEG